MGDYVVFDMFKGVMVQYFHEANEVVILSGMLFIDECVCSF